MKTTVVAAWLLSELLKMPHSHAPGETPEEYRERAALVTTALAEEATPYANGQGWSSTELAAAGLTLWKSESQMDRRIHAGEQHPVWTQDHMLARCGMQLHAGGLIPQEEWVKLGGTDLDSTHMCAKYGIRILVAMARQCGVWNGFSARRDRVARAFNAYATGGNCKPSEAMWARADLWLKMMGTRPDRSPVKGYRRASPNDITDGMKVFATKVKSQIGTSPEFGPGKVLPSESGQYVAFIEKHAAGKVGVSMLVKE